MHMADALLSPAVGGSMWAVSGAIIVHCSRKVRNEMDTSKIPLMGVLGAFIFAAQMINFAIPVTGSSGHLGGGLILTILLGPYAAFLTIASVLVVQALFFADGGLLALGCNILNLGFFPAFIAYPLMYKKLLGASPTSTKITSASIVAAIIGLQMGAFGVVVETVFSGISSLPFSTFLVMMQPIHLAIGFVEGLVTASVVLFIYKARPEIIQNALEARSTGNRPIRNVVLAFLAASVLLGGFVSLFASKNPDGLEWSITKLTKKETLWGPNSGLHATLNTLQEATAFLPGYSRKKQAAVSAHQSTQTGHVNNDKSTDDPKNPVETSVAGLVGGAITLMLSFLIGFALKRRQQLA
jgi:cobalt/nickel transport system permease protein